MAIITDEEYQRRRNMLIPNAENWADRVCGRDWTDHMYQHRLNWVVAWDKEYLDAMDRLWKELCEEVDRLEEERNISEASRGEAWGEGS